MVRKEDSLSPPLFVIVMEVLSRMISVLLNSGFMAGFLVRDTNRSTLNISHLLYGDDTLIFCEVEQDQIRALRALLLYFEVASSLKVNLD